MLLTNRPGQKSIKRRQIIGKHLLLAWYVLWTKLGDTETKNKED